MMLRLPSGGATGVPVPLLRLDFEDVVKIAANSAGQEILAPRASDRVVAIIASAPFGVSVGIPGSGWTEVDMPSGAFVTLVRAGESISINSGSATVQIVGVETS